MDTLQARQIGLDGSLAAPKQSSGPSAERQMDGDDSDGGEHEAHEVSTGAVGDVITSGTDPMAAPETDVRESQSGE